MLTGGFFYDRLVVETLRSQGDEVEVISLPWHSYGRRLGDNFSRTLFERLLSRDLEVLLQDELAHPSLIWLNRRLKKVAGFPIVAIVHLLRSSEPRPRWQNQIYRWLESRYLRYVDGFIWNSQTTRTATESLIRLQRPGVVAYPGRDHLAPIITPKEVLKRARQSGPLRILFVGNLSQVKGLHVLVEALSVLPRSTWSLIVVGSLTMAPDYVRHVREQIAHHGLDDRIVLTGALPNAQVASYMEQAQLLAVPSVYEGLGIAYVEGMGFGLPVIASMAGGAAEVVEHGRTGFLIAPGDVNTLSQHLSELIDDRDRLAYMGVAAIARHAVHPTWAESASEIKQFLCQLADRGYTE